ncbi:uncharacterized protein KY384_008106 [Bacidia gigantensis]|uniref:uncharacterized protein n=1 Tax=Bacidia gigantensis TaxID=2732470 RepID=UPI001D059970|nr:uncharacterized protein KY384_008106 [Bacidia gigantensis]KAG8526677.1 hypothetical protein KY384_008106 [Bacidia gigantensis]
MQTFRMLLQAYVLQATLTHAFPSVINDTRLEQLANLTEQVPQCKERPSPPAGSPPLLIDWDCREAINSISQEFPGNEPITVYNDLVPPLATPRIRAPYKKKEGSCQVIIDLAEGTATRFFHPDDLIRLLTRLRRRCVSDIELISMGGDIETQPHWGLFAYLRPSSQPWPDPLNDDGVVALPASETE